MSAIRNKLNRAANAPVMRQLVWFFGSTYFLLFYAAMTLLTSLLGLELLYFFVCLLIAVFCCLFSRDSKPILAPVIMIVYCISWKHTPQEGSDFFYDSTVHIHIIIYSALAVAALFFRFIVFPNGRNVFKESKLKIGIVLVVVALLLNGVFYSGYVINDLFLGFLIALSFFFFYIFFFNTLEPDSGMGIYMAKLLTITAGVIFIQLMKVLLFDGAVHDGSIDKDLVITGWGMSNNVGGMLGMMLPACFYLAYKLRHGLIYYVLGFIYFAGVCLTLSRTSILISGIIVFIAVIILFVKPSPVRKFAIIFTACVAAVGIVLFAVFFDKIREIFQVLFERGSDLSERDFIWMSGIDNFLRAPVFGVGFYEPIEAGWSYNIENWVFPDMYHNVFIQMLAACGIFGLIAYAVYLSEIVFIMKKRPTPESLFYASIMLAVFGMSLLDNHIFHVFPAMLYSVFLLLSEWEGEDDPIFNLHPLLVKIRERRRKGKASTAGGTGSASMKHSQLEKD